MDGRGDILRRGGAALLLAMAANALIRIVATEVFGVDSDYEHLAWRDFLSTTAAVVVLAVVTFMLLARFVGDPSAFTRVAVAVFVLSLLGPLSLLLAEDSGADGGIVATLVLMHVATALVVVGLLTDRAWRGGSRL
jgi:uncharacterized protein DUF6069